MTWWFGIDLWKRVVAFLLLGLLFGWLARAVDPSGQIGEFITNWIYPVGQAFVLAIKYLIVPLILTSLVAGVLALGDPVKLGSIGIKTMVLYSITTVFAVSLGLLLGTFVPMGMGLDASMFNASSAGDQDSVKSALSKAGEAGFVARYLQVDFVANIQRVISSPLMDGAVIVILTVLGFLAARKKMMVQFGVFLGLLAVSILFWGINPVTLIVFALIVGLVILLTVGAESPVGRFINQSSEHVMKTTIFVMELAPFGVFALMSWVIAEKGFGVLVNLGLLAFALYAACVLQIILVYGGLIKGVLRLKLLPFFRGITDAQAVAFSTASSSSTLPVSITCASRNLGIDKPVAASVLPLGATINMDGTAIYLGLIALFAAQALGIEMTPVMYLMVALTATLSSIGAAGIPSAGLLLATVVLEQIGVKVDQAVLIIAFILPFDRLLDMMRTLTNVTGDLAVATAVAKWEDELDVAVFEAEDRV